MPLVRQWGSRALVAGGALLLGTLGTVVAAPRATAQSAQSDASAANDLRADADALSGRYFTALERVQTLDDDIARNEQVVQDLRARAQQARARVRERALVAYTSSGTQLATLVDGSDSLDAARRAQLIDRVNEHDEDVYAALRRATQALDREQKELRATRQAQSDALDQLRSQGAAIDAKLAQAEAQDQARAAAARAQAQVQAPGSTAPSVSAAPTGASGSPLTSAPATTTPPAPRAPTPPPGYSGTPGTSPHHDDPFLTCVRRRESGGNYGVVNPAGPYLGAYQFLQSTWNVTAAHAGRSDLVGVPANVATPYDQDEMAWSLYQWQGAGPWGGGC